MNKDFENDIEVSLEKEIQFNLEKEKLEEVTKQINDEILKYIDKRKYIADYITDYRKNVIDEYRDDEDKLVEYFDHERFVKEEAYKTIDRRLKELTVLVSSPYFGKVDFKEIGFDDEENIYIGRFGMTPEGEYEPVVVDWRAPVSALFYTSSLGESSYKAPKGNINVELLGKRQFIIKKSKLLGLFDSAIDVKDDILQMVLGGNAGQKLRDIIMTIQEEQDNLIRQPKDKTIVVNGVAGSGKTTIALHRIAYLLYNHRDTLQDKVLILGPNNIFMEYISTVLPSLGEVGVKQTTFTDFALDFLELDDVMNFKDYMEKILNKDSDFIEDILYKTSLEYLKELDKFIENLDLEYFKIEDVKYKEDTVVPSSEIIKLFTEYYKDMPLFRRSKKVKRIIFSRLKDKRDEEVRNIEKEYKAAIAKLSKEELEQNENSLIMGRKTKIREVIKEVMRIKENLSWLRNPSSLELYKNMNNDKPLTQDDLAPILYLKIKLEGLKVKEEIKHVVIDEAQDYSPIQFIVVKELTRCNSLTIVGDSNQRLIPLKGETAMTIIEEFVPNINVEHFELNKSYRSTREIMTYANKYLEDQSIVPLVRDGKEVVEESFKREEDLIAKIEETLGNLQEQGYESIAVICRDLDETERIGKLLKNKTYIKILDKEDMLYNGGIVAIPSYFAKGLEFDSVIMIEDDRIAEENKLKYVMATRALHELYVYRN